MARLGSLYALSDEFINNAVLSSRISASTAQGNDLPKSISVEEESKAARAQTSETDQGKTCLTCGIGITARQYI